MKLLNGDCLELIKQIPDKSIDMILCDLPYGTTACKWDNIIPFDKLWNQYNRVIKDKRAIVLFATEPFTSKLITSNIDNFKEKLIWKKHKPSNIGCGRFMHLKYTEDIVVFGKGNIYNPIMIPRTSTRVKEAQKGNSKNWRTQRTTNEVSFNTLYEPKSWNCYNAEFKMPMNVLEFPAVVSNSKEKVGHPTQKPIKLLEYLIKTYTNDNMVVLDNTMGSGSTGVACVNTNRDFIGIELDVNYFNIAKKRIEEAINNKASKEEKINMPSPLQIGESLLR